MLLSFVISSKNLFEKFEKTFLSIVEQKTKNFEVILVLDKNIAENVKNSFAKEIFWANNNIKLVLNSSSKGTAISYNIAISLAEGKYVKFINEGDVLSPNFTEEIEKTINLYKDEQIDIFEYTIKLNGIITKNLISYLEEKKIYNLEVDKTPFAFINPNLHNKIFKTEILKTYKYPSKKFAHYDALFIYKILIQAKKYVYFSPQIEIENNFIEEYDYSVFEITKQWPHIFNYYRKIGRYKEFKEELEYAHIKNILHIWIWLISQYNNELLMEKAVDFVNHKFADRMAKFVKTNTIFKESKDTKFIKICNNYQKYIYDMQTNAKGTKWKKT